MVDLNDYDCERNEVNWWSNWASVRWITKNSYIILSNEFDESFFNRGGFLAPEDPSTVAVMESVFSKSQRKPYILLQRLKKYARIADALSPKYETVEKMSVLEMQNPSLRGNPDVTVENVSKENIREWCKAYLLSFYGDKKLISPVERIVRGISRKKNSNLLIAKHGTETAGVIASYREKGLCGLYCVGTIPRFRNLRVATTLVEKVYSDSKDDHRVILQTMLSDNVEKFYRKLGFRRIYLKQLFKRMS